MARPASRLSAEELRIAQLATEGNLSDRTSGWHPYRKFPKLRIPTRAQLHEPLASLVASPAYVPA